MNFESLIKEQNEMSKKIILKDCFKKPVKTVAGFDCCYRGNNQICAGVVLDYKTLETIEMKIVIRKETFPYVPGFLSYREGQGIISVYRSLKNTPDVIFIDGHGISHPRGIGLASYVGLVLDKPTIGIAKSILTGVIKDDKLFLNGKQVGWVIRKGKRKVFISPGQKISLKTSRELVLHTIIHRVPEPIRLADRYAAKVKNEKLQSE